MIALNLIDHMFDGSSAGSPLDQRNPYIQWKRMAKAGDVVVVTDNSLEDPRVLNFKNRIAWLFESPNPKTGFAYRLRKKWKFRKYQAVYTYDKRLLSCGAKFQLSTVGGSWIKEEDWGVHVKRRNLSVLASNKQNLPGHKLRHEAVSLFPDAFDGLFGRSHKFVDYKLDALKDFRYTLVIENQRLDYYFTEKLIDSFAAGSVPVYWGCPSIADFFNPSGMIQFETLADLSNILPGLSADDYHQRLPAIKENLERARAFRFPEKSLLTGMAQNPKLSFIESI